MAMLAPDWSYPERIGDRPCFAALDAPGRFVLLPERLAPSGSAGEAGLSLDLFAQDRGSAGAAAFGLATIRLAVEAPSLADRRALLLARSEGRLVGAAIESGLVRLTVASALAGAGGAATRAVQPFDASGGATLATQIRLTGEEAEVLAEALARDVTLIGMDAWMVVRGGAARVAATASVDLARFADSLATLAPEGVVATDAFVAALASPAALGITLDRALTGEAAALVPVALADRLTARFATLAPAPEHAKQAWLRLDLGDATAGTLRLDLDAAVSAPRFLTLNTSALLSADSAAPAIRRHEGRALDTGWRAVTVSTTLSGQRVGLYALVAELTAAPAPPARPTTERVSVALEEGSAPVAAALRLAPGEPLAYTLTVDATVPAGTAARTLTGAPRACTESVVVVTPADLPVTIVPITIDPAFAALASVRLVARSDDGGWQIDATAREGVIELVVAVPPDHAAASMKLQAVSRADGTSVSTESLPLAATRIDGFSFIEGDAQEARFWARFDSSAGTEILVECLPAGAPDDARAITLLRLRREAPEASFRWLPASPFDTTFRWRRRGAPWSAPCTDRAIVVTNETRGDEAMDGAGSGAERVIEGVTVTPQDAESWLYWPNAAEVARNADGAPQATLVAAGPGAFFALTTALRPDPATLERVRASLASGRSSPARLGPAPITVGAVELLLGDGAGTFRTVATATSSGAPPWSAAFNAVLDPVQAEAAKKAMAGERGWLAVRYPIAVTGATHMAGTLASMSASATVRLTEDGTSTAATASTATGVAAVATTTSASPSTAAIQTDAADWGLAPR